MRFGFPVYHKSDGNAYPVWVRLGEKSGDGPCIRWNDKVLSAERPFGENGSANEIVGRLAAAHDVYFKTDLIFPCEGGQICLEGQSFQLCLYACETWIPSEGGVDMLFTGQIQDGALCALGDNSRVEEKLICAMNHQAVLVAAEEDARSLFGGPLLLVEETGACGGESCLKQGEAYYPLRKNIDSIACRTTHDAVRTMKFNRKKHEHRILLSLEGAKWAYLLGRGFDLEPRIPQQHEVAHIPVEFSEKTFNDLLRLAMPSLKTHHPDEFERYKENNGNERRLFLNGILDAAIQNSGELFSNRYQNIYPGQNVLVGGATGSGKTELAYAMLLNTVSECDGNAIYVAPTKMLVYEAMETFRQMIPPLDADHGAKLKREDIIVSTGEDSDNDWRIANGDFKVAFIVYEKANLFMKSNKLVKRISLVVVDELHMFADEFRGGSLDLLVAKVLEEAARRDDNTYNPSSNKLRVMGITTEGVLEDIKLREFLQGDDDEILLLASQQRPISVSHYIQPHFDGKEFPPEIIGEFSRNTDRSLPYYRLSQLKDRADYLTGAPESVNLAHYIKMHSAGYGKVIVAGSGIAYLRKLGKEVAAARKDYVRLSNKDASELSEALNKANLSSTPAKMLLERAKKGVFFHYSTLDPSVRRIMARLFRQENKDARYPDMLFATETITYGVNLPADCMILTSIEFSRQHAITEQYAPKHLTPQQYHNMVGRVGRYGHTDLEKECKVVVIAKSQSEWHSILNNYTGLSNCAAGGVSRVELRQAKQRHEETVSLQEISYSLFRAVLDSLRYMQLSKGGPVSLAKIIDFMRHTFMWKCWRMNDESPLIKLVESIIEQTVNLSKTSGIPTIISEEESPVLGERQYMLTFEGEALIDTGTKWQSIVPMRYWLKKVAECDWDTPVELLIPAFVTCRELWHQYRRFFEESEYEQAFAAEAGETIAFKILKEELARLSLPENRVEVVAGMISRLFDEYGKGLKLDDMGTGINQHSRAVFYRMIAAMFMWVRGEELERINRLRHSNPDDPVEEDRVENFNDRFGQKAGWLTLMCFRFFISSEGLLAEKHARKLPSLGLRLRYGLPEDGLPFFRGSVLDSRLSRKEVLSLLKSGASPEAIILSDNPDGLMEDISRKTREALEAGSLTSTPKRIVDNMFKYYSSSVEELCYVFGRKRTFRSEWLNMADSVRNIFDKYRYKESLTEKWSSYIDKFMDRFVLALKADDLRVIKVIGGSVLSLSRGSDEDVTTITLKFCSHDEVVPDHSQLGFLVVRLPWRGKKDLGRNNLEMSINGVISFGILLNGGYLSMKATRSWIDRAVREGRRICTPHDLLSIKPVRGRIPSELLEYILNMKEPDIY